MSRIKLVRLSDNAAEKRKRSVRFPPVSTDVHLLLAQICQLMTTMKLEIKTLEKMSLTAAEQVSTIASRLIALESRIETLENRSQIKIIH